MKPPPCPQRSPDLSGCSGVCPICQSKTAPFLAKNLPLYRCLSCALIFQPPSPPKSPKTPKTPNFYTPNVPSWGTSDPRLSEPTYQMKKQTFRLLFKTLSPCLSNLRDLGNIGNLKKPQLLDIGTGTGALLEVANEFGFDATGLEPDKKFAQKAKERGLKVINSTLEKARLPTHSFDIITMFDVLEHIPDLHSALSSIVKTIKPNGLLILSTPNTSSLSFKLMDSYWPHFKKEHIYYFNPKSLKTLISPYGFITLKILNSPKSLTLDYIAGYFSAFPTPILSPLSRFLIRILPHSLTQLPINLPNGNMLVIAKKSNLEL